MGCDWKSGIKVYSVWRHSSCAGGTPAQDECLQTLKGNWFCSKHKVTFN